MAKLKIKLKKLLLKKSKEHKPVHSKSSNSQYQMTSSYYYQQNFCEPNVLLAIQDFCKPGDTVFDVGVFCGSLSLAMSRLVGPKGLVCSFEASPNNIGQATYNLAQNMCSNVQLYHYAIYKKSHQTVSLFSGSHMGADTIVESFKPAQPNQVFDVPTLALDDYVQHTGIAPSFIKMDIEGAEYNALKGFEKFIKKHKPHLILEQGRDSFECFDFLFNLGYKAVDLSTYTKINKSQDLPEEVGIFNILFVHSSKTQQLPHFTTSSKKLYGSLSSKDFRLVNDRPSSLLSKAIQFKKGRYYIQTNFSSAGPDNELMIGLQKKGSQIFRYHGTSDNLSKNYKDWVIHIDQESELNFYFNYLKGTSAYAIEEVKIFSLPEFDSIERPFAQ